MRPRKCRYAILSHVKHITSKTAQNQPADDWYWPMIGVSLVPADCSVSFSAIKPSDWCVLYKRVIQSGGGNSSGLTSSAASSSLPTTGSGYGSYTAADSQTSSYGTGAGFDLNAAYNNYAQLYEQYYNMQTQAVICLMLLYFFKLL